MPIIDVDEPREQVNRGFLLQPVAARSCCSLSCWVAARSCCIESFAAAGPLRVSNAGACNNWTQERRVALQDLRQGWNQRRCERVQQLLFAAVQMVRCVALRCVALRCVALRCVALRCVALRCVGCFGSFGWSEGWLVRGLLQKAALVLGGRRGWAGEGILENGAALSRA